MSIDFARIPKELRRAVIRAKVESMINEGVENDSRMKRLYSDIERGHLAALAIQHQVDPTTLNKLMEIPLTEERLRDAGLLNNDNYHNNWIREKAGVPRR